MKLTLLFSVLSMSLLVGCAQHTPEPTKESPVVTEATATCGAKKECPCKKAGKVCEGSKCTKCNKGDKTECSKCKKCDKAKKEGCACSKEKGSKSCGK